MSSSCHCVIINTECANLNSVKYALERLDIAVTVSDDANIIENASHVILPGVGSAKAAMLSLQQKNLIDTIKSLHQPVLGICLGMQLLTNFSTEGNTVTKCLGIIDTQIEPLISESLPLPHMGWNQLIHQQHSLFKNIPQNSHVYFVHGYRAPESDFTLATSKYDETFSAAIGMNNFMGVQFHPEKSATIGGQILKNFMEISS